MKSNLIAAVLAACALVTPVGAASNLPAYEACITANAAKFRADVELPRYLPSTMVELQVFENQVASAGHDRAWFDLQVALNNNIVNGPLGQSNVANRHKKLVNACMRHFVCGPVTLMTTDCPAK